MPSWTAVPLDYEPWTGKSDVFARSAAPFDDSFGKLTPAKDAARQAFFHDHLRRIAWHLGSPTIPVFIDFNGEKRRMDKGCVGHAIAAGVLLRPSNDADGFVAEVQLSMQLSNRP